MVSIFIISWHCSYRRISFLGEKCIRVCYSPKLKIKTAKFAKHLLQIIFEAWTVWVWRYGLFGHKYFISNLLNYRSLKPRNNFLFRNLGFEGVFVSVIWRVLDYVCWLSNSHPYRGERRRLRKRKLFFWRNGLAFNLNQSLQSLTNSRYSKMDITFVKQKYEFSLQLKRPQECSVREHQAV